MQLTWTMLRPGFFAQNIATAYRQDIVEHDRIYLPTKDGLVAFIDRRDIGDVAALTLTAGHEEKASHLTGPEAFTFSQVAEMLSTVLGRTVCYEEASVLAYFNHLRQQGLAFPYALVQTILHTGLRRGDAEMVTCTIVNQADANIIVEKQTDPRRLEPPFDFTTDYGAGAFQLSEGQTNDSRDLDPGTYSVAETGPDGWELESATCSNGSDLDAYEGDVVMAPSDEPRAERPRFVVYRLLKKKSLYRGRNLGIRAVCRS